jgi:hypothetical protein
MESAMRRGSWVKRIVLGAAIVVSAAGCGSNEATNIDESSTVELLLCQEYTLTNPDGTQYQEHERYVLPAINRKLQLYPELAEWVGFNQVSTCEGGRAFLRGFREFSEAHPGFDDNEDYEPPAVDPGPYPGPPPTLEEPKLLNAAATFNYPIVRLANNRGSTCTGVFIAKNWILTAAHCMAYQSTTTPKVKTQPLSGYYPYRMDRPDSRAATLGKIYAVSKIDGHLLQYPHPSWMGWDPSRPVAEAPRWDLGLLYVDGWQYDAILPPSPSNSAIRIAARSMSATETLNFSGWGPGTWNKAAGTLGPTDTLRTGNLVPTSVGFDTFSWTVPSTGIRPCIGDSGGPAMRSVTVAGASQWVVVATLGGNVTDLSDPCAETGDNIGFPRMDIYSTINFINGTMQIWNGALFKCKEYTLGGTTSVEYRRCWGDVCSGQADCAANQVCRGLIEGRPNIKGQCLPKAGLVLGGAGP